jgi:acetamidase/formamidase
MAYPTTSTPAIRTIHKEHQHLSWDNSRRPALTVAPGETVGFKDIDGTLGQLTRDSTARDVGNLDLSRVNAISGPVFVDGAQPGDVLKVTLVGFESPGWGWTAIIPEFGLLADDFPDPAINIWNYDPGFGKLAAYSPGARVPLKPFCGTVGVARAEPGSHSTIPPYRGGGNMDIRDLTLGVELYLPIEVEGALFSIGDPHAAQGDGEICGTAIETLANVSVRLDLEKGTPLSFPRFVTPGPVTRHLDAKGYDVTTGIGPDLMDAAKDCVRGMIDLIGARHSMRPEDAYMLLSVCADLRISEVVDRPNWVVSCYLPRLVFD